jgi:OOP family OmpA-OmpF porin
VSQQTDARVDPVEARTGAVEERAGQLESRAGQLETRQRQLDDQEKQTEQQLGQVQTQVDQVKTEADQAIQGVEDVNQRLTSLDNYEEKYSETIYFAVSSARLTDEGKQKLDKLAQQAKNEKGYIIEAAGYADTTGGGTYNQRLSEARADAVIQYLEQQNDIAIYRILTPAGMGTTHEAASNDTRAGRKLNRRVEVKVLVNQGMAGDADEPTETSSANNPSR